MRVRFDLRNMDKTRSAADRIYFKKLVQEKNQIVDVDNPDRRRKVVEVLERMMGFGPHWGPTRAELLRLRTLFPGPPSNEDCKKIKRELTIFFRKLLDVVPDVDLSDEVEEAPETEIPEAPTTQMGDTGTSLDETELLERLQALRNNVVSTVFPEGWSDEDTMVLPVDSYTVMYEKLRGRFEGSEKDYLDALLDEQEKFINETSPDIIMSICEKVGPVLHLIRGRKKLLK